MGNETAGSNVVYSFSTVPSSANLLYLALKKQKRKKKKEKEKKTRTKHTHTQHQPNPTQPSPPPFFFPPCPSLAPPLIPPTSFNSLSLSLSLSTYFLSDPFSLLDSIACVASFRRSLILVLVYCVAAAESMGSIGADLCSRIYPEPVDDFDRLPDSLILLIFNRIGDVKALGRCCVVSRRFHSLVPQVDNVVVRVDCVISDDDPSSNSSASAAAAAAGDKSRHPISSLFRIFFSGLFKPLQSLSQLIIPSSRRLPLPEDFDSEAEQNTVTHHSPTQVLKNFNEIKLLRIELPTGELGIDDGVLLKWKAEFGSTLDSCVILGASSVVQGANTAYNCLGSDNGVESDNGSIPESFYTNGGLKLRVVWTISSLIAASARHYLLQPIIAEHKTLESLVLTDADGQGVLSMNKDQLEELRVKPLSASSASKRTLVPALNMRLWYAPHLELPNGVVLKGATLVAIRPSEQPKKEAAVSEGNWVASAFEEPFGTAARMLVKRRTYCLEMNSF